MTLFKKDDDRKITQFEKTWTSDSDGNASVLLDDYKGYEIVAVQTVPGEDGDRTTALPTIAYDVTCIDAYGFDWFYGEGIDRSATVAEAFCRNGQIPFPNSATLTIVNAGNTKQGLVNIWVA